MRSLYELYRRSRKATRIALLRLLRPRRFDACGCGLSKTGTHSLAGIFSSYRSEHHPDAKIRLDLASRYLTGAIDLAQARRILARRDRWIWLEMESSSLVGTLIEPMVEACPKKKFIHTIRDVFSWCDSWLDHNINSPPEPSSAWAHFDRVRLKIGELPPTKYDSPLVDRGLPPLRSYFELWRDHNRRVRDVVPAERLLIVRTNEILDMIPIMAQWLGIPPGTLNMERARLFAAPRKHGTLALLDRSYVSEMAEAVCGELMEQHFRV